MAPIITEPTSPRPRRQAFIATCSPDELLGQVIQTLYPRYNIDAPHLLALRQVLSSAVVAPRKPPTLKRTRPDRRIGEIDSVHDTPRSSPHGGNGAPVSANQSFYFHHKDPDFKRLLPQVDRSRYEWPDEPASQSGSDSEEAPDTRESTESNISTISAAATAQRNASFQPTASTTSASTDRKDKSITGANQRLKKSQGTALEQPFSSNPSFDPNLPQKDVPKNLKGPPPPSIPTITITSPDVKPKKATIEHDNTELSAPLLHAADIAIKLPDTQNIDSIPGLSSAPVFHISQPFDTQDTVNSTQQSEVLSPPVDFVHFTPPTQEDTQDVAMSQVNTPDVTEFATASKLSTKASQQSSRRSVHSSSQSTFSTSSLGKRSREKSETSDYPLCLKRSKSVK